MINKHDLENIRVALSLYRAEETFNYRVVHESLVPWNIMNLDIQETPYGDYPCRINVTRKEWQHYLKQAAENIDYTNFKDAVHDRGGDVDRLDRYFSVWAVNTGMKLQFFTGVKLQTSDKKF